MQRAGGKIEKIAHPAVEAQAIDQVSDAAGDDQRQRDFIALRVHSSSKKHDRCKNESDGHNAIEDRHAQLPRKIRSDAEEGPGVLGVQQREHAEMTRRFSAQCFARDDLRFLIHCEQDDHQREQSRSPAHINNSPSAREGPNRRHILESARQIAVGKGPRGIDLPPNGRELWVAHRGDGALSVIDTATDKVLQTINTGTKMANRLKFTREGRRVLISDVPSNQVLVYDAFTKQLVKKIDTEAGPEGILIAPDRKRAFIACANAGKVLVLDLDTLTITGSVATGKQPDGMAWVQ